MFIMWYEITLTTHDAGNQLTDKDYALAQAISALELFQVAEVGSI